MSAAVVVYDGSCTFCVRCAEWLTAQESVVPLQLRPSDDRWAMERFGFLPGYGAELLVAMPDGRVWSGPDAFLAALWLLRRYQRLAASLSGPSAGRMARAVFRGLSSHRGKLGALLGLEDCGDGSCGR